jgi:hypothetical protein
MKMKSKLAKPAMCQSPKEIRVTIIDEPRQQPQIIKVEVIPVKQETRTIHVPLIHAEQESIWVAVTTES